MSQFINPIFSAMIYRKYNEKSFMFLLDPHILITLLGCCFLHFFIREVIIRELEDSLTTHTISTSM